MTVLIARRKPFCITCKLQRKHWIQYSNAKGQESFCDNLKSESEVSFFVGFNMMMMIYYRVDSVRKKMISRPSLNAAEAAVV